MATSQSFDWAQFYGPTAAADSVTVSTGSSQPDPVHNIEGRVGKSAGRRRSRASRRAPTTLLNTDPTNFRAMVQQFTGAPAGPYQDRAGPVINFGYGPGPGLGQAPVQYNQQQLNQGGPVYVDGTGGFPQGGICNNGFVQGFNFDANDSINTAGSGGAFMDGVGMRGDPANERNGGYFL